MADLNYGKSLKSLPFRLAKRMKRFDRKVNRRMKEIVVHTHLTIASGTPVDTGQARSNWRGTGAFIQPKDVIEPYAPGKKLGIGETSNLLAANAQVQRAAKAWWSSTGKRFHIYNNWPLIDALNDGTISKQGSHFVEAGDRVALNMMKQTKWLDK